MKNKKRKVLIISIVFITIIIIGIAVFSLITNNVNKNIDEIEKALSNQNYKEACTVIKDNRLSSNNKVKSSLNKEIEKYKVNNEKELVNLTEEDWNNIEDLYKLTDELNIKEVSFNYLAGLLEIKEDYGEYFKAILWINGADYEQFQIYQQLSSADESGLSQTVNLLSKYSFEKYGLENTYIKELNIETQNLIRAYNNILTALKTRNENMLEEAKQVGTNTLSNIADIQINILLKSSEVSNAIKQLSKIL